jgi:protein associated with RNAse G/E
MVDLDLDVVKRRDGRVHIDDEDEFAEHQVAMGYPPHVAATARADCARVFLAMEAGDEPFGSVGQMWLQRWIATAADR